MKEFLWKASNCFKSLSTSLLIGRFRKCQQE
jgi:hypothetical protein